MSRWRLSMIGIRLVILGATMLCAAGAAAQSLTWIDDLGAAQQSATQSKKPLLIFFTSADSTFAKGIETWLGAADLKPALDHFILVRHSMTDNDELATKLTVYRAGTILVYSFDGVGIAKIAGAETASALKSEIFKALTSAGIQIDSTPPPGAAPSTPESGAPPAGPANSSTVYLKLPKGLQIGKPIVRHATDSSTVSLGTLQQGKNYVLQLKGAFGTKRNVIGGSDPVYNFYSPETKDKLTSSTFVRFTDNGYTIAGYFRKSNLTLPPYTTAHTYDVPLVGQGKPLELRLVEKNEYSYTDNSGDITFTLFEGAP